MKDVKWNMENSISEAGASFIHPWLARRPGLPAPVNPKPLIGIKPDVFLDHAGE
jgi:hypothetical protein